MELLRPTPPDADLTSPLSAGALSFGNVSRNAVRAAGSETSELPDDLNANASERGAAAGDGGGASIRQPPRHTGGGSPETAGSVGPDSESRASDCMGGTHPATTTTARHVHAATLIQAAYRGFAARNAVVQQQYADMLAAQLEGIDAAPSDGMMPVVDDDEIGRGQDGCVGIDAPTACDHPETRKARLAALITGDASVRDTYDVHCLMRRGAGDGGCAGALEITKAATVAYEHPLIHYVANGCKWGDGPVLVRLGDALPGAENACGDVDDAAAAAPSAARVTETDAHASLDGVGAASAGLEAVVREAEGPPHHDLDPAPAETPGERIEHFLLQRGVNVLLYAGVPVPIPPGDRSGRRSSTTARRASASAARRRSSSNSNRSGVGKQPVAHAASDGDDDPYSSLLAAFAALEVTPYGAVQAPPAAHASVVKPRRRSRTASAAAAADGTPVRKRGGRSSAGTATAACAECGRPRPSEGSSAPPVYPVRPLDRFQSLLPLEESCPDAAQGLALLTRGAALDILQELKAKAARHGACRCPQHGTSGRRRSRSSPAAPERTPAGAAVDAASPLVNHAHHPDRIPRSNLKIPQYPGRGLRDVVGGVVDRLYRPNYVLSKRERDAHRSRLVKMRNRKLLLDDQTDARLQITREELRDRHQLQHAIVQKFMAVANPFLGGAVRGGEEHGRHGAQHHPSQYHATPTRRRLSIGTQHAVDVATVERVLRLQVDSGRAKIEDDEARVRAQLRKAWAHALARVLRSRRRQVGTIHHKTRTLEEDGGPVVVRHTPSPPPPVAADGGGSPRAVGGTPAPPAVAAAAPAATPPAAAAATPPAFADGGVDGSPLQLRTRAAGRGSPTPTKRRGHTHPPQPAPTPSRGRGSPAPRSAMPANPTRLAPVRAPYPARKVGHALVSDEQLRLMDALKQAELKGIR